MLFILNIVGNFLAFDLNCLIKIRATQKHISTRFERTIMACFSDNFRCVIDRLDRYKDLYVLLDLSLITLVFS